MNGEAASRNLNRKLAQLERIQNKISNAELDLKVALATGKDSQVSKIQNEIIGLKAVTQDLELEIDQLNNKIADFENKIIYDHQQVINSHFKLKGKYHRSYWIFSILGLILFFVGLGSPIMFLGIVFFIYGMSRWPKVQDQKSIIALMEAGMSEDEAIDYIRASKKRAAIKVKNDQREREMLADEIARRMRR